MGNSRSADEDTKRYREGYPGKEDDENMNKNFLFYSNELKCLPDNVTIEQAHKLWWDNFSFLEEGHGFIQWLFPIREGGMNALAQDLQLHEARRIVADPVLHARFVTSYKMMLRFYGIELIDETTGAVQRCEETYVTQYANLNMSSHNYLRMTRILKCLGEMNLEHYKKPLLEHFCNEVYGNKQLGRCRESLESYWSGTLRNDAERDELRSKMPERKPQSDKEIIDTHLGPDMFVSEEEEEETVAGRMARLTPNARAWRAVKVPKEGDNEFDGLLALVDFEETYGFVDDVAVTNPEVLAKVKAPASMGVAVLVAALRGTPPETLDPALATDPFIECLVFDAPSEGTDFITIDIEGNSNTLISTFGDKVVAALKHDKPVYLRNAAEHDDITSSGLRAAAYMHALLVLGVNVEEASEALLFHLGANPITSPSYILQLSTLIDVPEPTTSSYMEEVDGGQEAEEMAATGLPDITGA